MDIHAQRVGVAGPHGPLLKPTSLRVPPGELVVVAGPPGAGHTAFGLVVSGRLRPSTGSVAPDAAELRKQVVLVDSPDVNEPEASLSLAGVVGEELAMNGQRSGRKAVADWLVERGAEEHLDTRFEYVPADLRCRLLLELAAERPGARALVVDTPDRYHGDPTDWLATARRHVTPELSVIVLCTTTSAAVLGIPVALLGSDNTEPAEEEHTAKHALPLDPTALDLHPVAPPADNAVTAGATAATAPTVPSPPTGPTAPAAPTTRNPQSAQDTQSPQSAPTVPKQSWFKQHFGPTRRHQAAPDQAEHDRAWPQHEPEPEQPGTTSTQTTGTQTTATDTTETAKRPATDVGEPTRPALRPAPRPAVDHAEENQ